MVIVYINNNKYDVDASKNLLQNCLSVNIDIPYFCWHPALGSIGACRLCAVKQFSDVNDTVGKIVMACMSPTVNNMIISTIDYESKRFRKGIIELLMTNHPHDCPICEEGGNCHLQDMTVMNNHNYRRYRYKKKTYNNQYLGPFVSHNMNRCISCYRCVRYYKDYAGGIDFGVYGVNNGIYFGRLQDGVLENEHSGNLIEICPTGVFTDKLYSKNYNRKWDLQYSPSICHGCSIGCNISIGERYGKLNKIENRYHDSINRYFLCDLGRFGNHYVNTKNRYTNPIKNENGNIIKLNKLDSITMAKNILKNNENVIGIGSIRASLESNFSLRKLVGKDNFYSGMTENDHECVKFIIDVLENSGIYIPTLSEIENYDVILIIGEDITQTSARLDLSIRQSHYRNQVDDNICHIPDWHSVALKNISDDSKKCIYIIHTHETKLDSIAKINYYGSIVEQEIFIGAVSDIINTTNFSIKYLDPLLKKQVFAISSALSCCKKPLIISGSHSCSINLIKSAVNIANGLRNLKKDVGLVLLTPSANSLGLGMMSNLSIYHGIDRILNGNINTLIVLENNLYKIMLKDTIINLSKKLKNIIVFDNQNTDMLNISTLFFPTSNFSESSGTIVNYEGRAQRFFSSFNTKIYDIDSNILESWNWLYKIYFQIYEIKNYKINLDDVIQEYSEEIQHFKKIKYISPDANFRIINKKIARSPHRISGRTSIFSKRNVHEPKQQEDKDTMFAFSMEGIQQPSKDIKYVPFLWSPGWNSINALNKYNISQYNSGLRLFEKNKLNEQYFFHIHHNNINLKKNWMIIPYYKLLGSEELSQKLQEIKKTCSNIYAVLNIQYKNIMKLKKNSMIEFICLNQSFKFLVKFSVKLPLYQIGLPIGYEGLPRILIGKVAKNVRGIS